jgi:hypothetical protein
LAWCVVDEDDPALVSLPEQEEAVEGLVELVAGLVEMCHRSRHRDMRHALDDGQQGVLDVPRLLQEPVESRHAVDAALLDTWPLSFPLAPRHHRIVLVCPAGALSRKPSARPITVA